MQVNEVIAYKGFDADLKCRGYQYAVGQTYEHEGKVKACGSGFHACEHPLNVFGYYPPAGSRFAVVRMSGEISRELNGDTKLASAKITIDAEIGIPTLVQRAVEWVVVRCTPEGEAATGDQGAASATGDQGAASATGYQGAASATGYQGAASATGDQGAASATGDQGAASATGYQGAASATGDHGAASATGYQGAASATGDHGAASATGYQGAASATGDHGAASATGTRGAASATGYRGAASATGKASVALSAGPDGKARASGGCALFLVNRDDGGAIRHVFASKVGENGVEPDKWYSLDDDGVLVEVPQ